MSQTFTAKIWTSITVLAPTFLQRRHAYSEKYFTVV